MSTSTNSGAPPTRVAWTLILASIGAFITSLDVVVVSTALPTLQKDLGASLSDLGSAGPPPVLGRRTERGGAGPRGPAAPRAAGTPSGGLGQPPSAQLRGFRPR